jgi:hypothetical protein
VVRFKSFYFEKIFTGKKIHDNEMRSFVGPYFHYMMMSAPSIGQSDHPYIDMRI